MLHDERQADQAGALGGDAPRPASWKGKTVLPSVLSSFRTGPLAGTLLPEYRGFGLANVAPTITQHFGLATHLPALSAAVLPPSLLAGVDRIVTLLIDALGYHHLMQAIDQGQAPYLATLCQRTAAAYAPITSTFPSSTVTALTTMGTGLPATQHGITAEKLYDAELGTTIHVPSFTPVLAGQSLTNSGVDPVAWLGHPTVYEALTAQGVTAIVVNHATFEGTPLSRINHRGADYIGCHSIADLCSNLRTVIESAPAPVYIHAYWGLLDTIAHDYGPGSSQYLAELQVIDYAIGAILLRDLHAPRTLLLILADHGQITVAPDRWTWLNDHPELLALLQCPPAGDPRAVVLYVQDGDATAARAYIEHHLAYCAHLLPVEEAVRVGLYGPEPIPPRVRGRLGQLLVLARDNWMVRYEYPGKARTRWQIGTHGGLTREELLVPLLAVRLDE